jgi:hypothetical protein
LVKFGLTSEGVLQSHNFCKNSAPVNTIVTRIFKTLTSGDRFHM